MREHFNDGVEFARFLAHRFVTDKAPNSAAALTYTTLFAVVPMMTVMFSMLSLIPAFHGMGESIQTFIFRNFVPSAGEAVETYLKSFTTQARHLTWVGVVFLAVTAFTMLVTIEKAFNEIWRVRQPRRGVGRFLLYWAILSLGPLLLGAGFAVTTYITSLSLLHGPDALPGAETLLGLMPLAFSVAAFTLLYSAVPNARVPVRHALMGGVFTAVLFEAAKTLFGLYVSLFPGYQLIYGAFATVPIFLLWIYLSWMIVLLGVLRVFLQRQQLGQSLRLTHLHRAGWLLPEDEWEELLDFLEKEQFVCRAGGGEWVLCRDLGAYSLHRLLNRCPWPMPSRERMPANLDEAWYPPFQQAMERLQVEQEALFGESLAHWLADGTSGVKVT
ncbi:TPA: YihY family inner membrane protein [Pseudomonas aeruginosa]|uniref:YihY family inner membrane protein n=1 Tax=Pseudomonas aeruginosa TaxID=287 RepID=UPI001A1F3A51|nr:YihY family inner membrane protein [Pseudomonas aeruginosa]MBH8867145.1 YihY family inner membrane protein [Pseudomonas aeruginosa]MCW0969179.1 YihY family inner membrane protein [Pseudomonas aeruginosa]HBN8490321.1 YihY family inner membrane protein [Pseudomonas aeruginosa]HBO1951864.1 YihY family inner membrane protein [Pseudomonas aeruginosa]HBO2031347.1 YihY family inner membrane protein [Pseudomonas aeruginosa]